jgi:hypothetical protein
MTRCLVFLVYPEQIGHEEQRKNMGKYLWVKERLKHEEASE